MSKKFVYTIQVAKSLKRQIQKIYQKLRFLRELDQLDNSQIIHYLFFDKLRDSLDNLERLLQNEKFTKILGDITYNKKEDKIGKSI